MINFIKPDVYCIIYLKLDVYHIISSQMYIVLSVQCMGPENIEVMQITINLTEYVLIFLNLISRYVTRTIIIYCKATFLGFHVASCVI